MKFKTLFASLIIAASSSAFAADDLKAVLDEAKAEYKKAEEMGFAWRDTAKFMKQAEEEKDAEKAMKLAKKALKQAKDAQVQAEAAKNAGPTF